MPDRKGIIRLAGGVANDCLELCFFRAPKLPVPAKAFAKDSGFVDVKAGSQSQRSKTQFLLPCADELAKCLQVLFISVIPGNSLPEQDQIVIVADEFAERFQLAGHGAHLLTPNGTKQAHLVPEVFYAFAPFVEVFGCGFFKNRRATASATAVAPVHSGGEGLPAVGSNAQFLKESAGFAQNPGDGCWGGLLIIAGELLPTALLKGPFDILNRVCRKLPFEMREQFVEGFERDVGVAGGS